MSIILRILIGRFESENDRWQFIIEIRKTEINPFFLHQSIEEKMHYAYG